MKLPKSNPRRKKVSPGHANEQYMPKLPYKISPDGYYYLEEKSADVSVPKAKPKAQRRKKGGRIY